MPEVPPVIPSSLPSQSQANHPQSSTVPSSPVMPDESGGTQTLDALSRTSSNTAKAKLFPSESAPRFDQGVQAAKAQRISNYLSQKGSIRGSSSLSQEMIDEPDNVSGNKGKERPGLLKAYLEKIEKIKALRQKTGAFSVEVESKVAAFTVEAQRIQQRYPHSGLALGASKIEGDTPHAGKSLDSGPVLGEESAARQSINPSHANKAMSVLSADQKQLVTLIRDAQKLQQQLSQASKSMRQLPFSWYQRAQESVASARTINQKRFKEITLQKLLGNLKHLGYEVSSVLADQEGRVIESLREIGCNMEIQKLDEEQDRQFLADGTFDESKGVTILDIKTTGGLTYSLMGWGRNNRDEGRNLTTGQIFKGKPSEFWNEKIVNGRVKVESISVSEVFVTPSTSALATHLLVQHAPEDMQVHLAERVRDFGLSMEDLDDFMAFSYVFCKEHQGSVCGQYDLDDNPQLGKVLDSMRGNVWIQYEDEGEEQLVSYCFQAPGQQKPEEIRGVSAESLDAPEFIGTPSKLLEKIMGQERRETHCISLISTVPLCAEFAPTDHENVSDQIKEGLRILEDAGLPIDSEDEALQQDFGKFLYLDSQGGLPRMMNHVLKQYVEAWSEKANPEDKIKVTQRLSAAGPLNLGQNLLGYQLQFANGYDLRHVTFYESGKNEAGENRIVFDDVLGNPTDASEIEKVLIDEGWRNGGAIDILHFEGRGVQFTQAGLSDDGNSQKSE